MKKYNFERIEIYRRYRRILKIKFEKLGKIRLLEIFKSNQGKTQRESCIRVEIKRNFLRKVYNKEIHILEYESLLKSV